MGLCLGCGRKSEIRTKVVHKKNKKLKTKTSSVELGIAETSNSFLHRMLQT